MSKCSWCRQEIEGRRVRIKIPTRGTVRLCRQCAAGWLGMFGYTAGLVGELVSRRRRPDFTTMFGRGAMGSAFAGYRDRSER